MLVKLRYFSREELLQSGGKPQPLPPNLEKNIIALAIALDAFRHWWGRPITVTSGYRTPEHNAAIGGVPNSAHVRALAADCYSEPFGEFCAFAQKWWPGGVGIYKGHVHLDLEAYRRWRV
jgi:uncharacterized protein YcbK (DUF882 family)